MQRDFWVIGGLVVFFGLIGGAASERDVPPWLRITAPHRHEEGRYDFTEGRSLAESFVPTSTYLSAKEAELAQAHDEPLVRSPAEYEKKMVDEASVPALSDLAKV